MGNWEKMTFGVFLALLGIFGISHGGDVTCTKDNYIMTGLEFSDCQKNALKSFKADDTSPDINPCAVLKDVVDKCATIVQRCFTERGWQRGKLVFLDLLALQFPNHNHCDVFSKNKNNTDVPLKLKDEKCSVVDEVSLLTEIRLCNNDAQTNVVNRISHHKASVGSVHKSLNSTEYRDSILYYAYPELCKGLKNVTDTCFKPKLSRCYDDSDAYFHYAYMLEELKRAGIILALHLLPHALVGVDVLHCPVFLESPDSWSITGYSPNQTVLILAIVLSLVLVFTLFTSLGMLAIFKFRLFPRFRAWVHNEPYEDIVINEQQNVREMTPISDDSQEIRAAAEQELPSIQELTRGKNSGQSSTVSMANLRHEESAQST